MRYLTWLMRIALFVALLGFAVKNNGLVSLRYLFGYEWQVPLVVALLCFLVAGVLIGMLALLGVVVRLRGELAQARKTLKMKRTANPAEEKEFPSEQLS